jgi:beta-N-acetylhexosaminidase
MAELRRLASAVIQLGFAGDDPPGWLQRALADGLGGVLLWNRDGAAETVAALRSENPGVLVAMSEAGGSEDWPANGALGVLDPATTGKVASAIGHDLAAAGIAMKYAPVADVNSNPFNPIIGTRSFGSSPGPVASHVVAYVEGIQATGVAACVKHFPGHGDTSLDSHLGLPTVGTDAGELFDGPLRPFRAAAEAGARAMMTAHIRLPAIDDLPATLSRTLLTDILRGELGYDGLVVTDALEMAALERAYGLEESAVAAIAAGADALFLGGWQDPAAGLTRVRDALIAAVSAGRLPEERLAEAAGRVSGLSAWCDRARSTDGHAPATGIGRTAAHDAIRVTGTITPLRTAPHVIELAPPWGVRGLRTPWGLLAAMTRRWAGTTGERVDREGLQPAAIPADRPLVIVVRDAYRHPWVGAVLAATLQARPDATVVEMGLPVGQAPRCAAYLTTSSATAVSSEAVADLLTEPRRP